jgi:O-antigen ligase
MRALLESLLFLIPAALFLGRGQALRTLIIFSVISMPFKTDYSLYDGGLGNWTSDLVLNLSDIWLGLLGVVAFSKSGSEAFRGMFSSPGIRGYLAYLIANALSLVESTARPVTFLQVLMLVQMLMFNYVAIYAATRTEEGARAFLTGVQAMIAIQGTIGILQFAQHSNFLLCSTGAGGAQEAFVGEDGVGLIRVVGTIGKPNGFGMVMSWMILLNLAFLSPVPNFRGFFPYLSVVLAGGGLLFSFSRGSWLGLTLGSLCLVLYLAKERGRGAWKILVGTAVVCGLVALVAAPLISTRLNTDDQNAAHSRVPLVQIALNIFKAHPVFGCGANTYRANMYSYVPVDFEQKFIDQVHNHYLLILAESGIIGITGLACFLWGIRKSASRCLAQRGDLVTRLFGLGLMLILIETCFHTMVEPLNSRLHHGLILMVMAVADASCRRSIEEESIPEAEEPTPEEEVRAA